MNKKDNKSKHQTIFCTPISVLIKNKEKFRAMPASLFDYMINKELSSTAMVIMVRMLQEELYEKITVNKIQRRLNAKSRKPILKALITLEEVGLTKRMLHERIGKDTFDYIWYFTDTPNCFENRLIEETTLS